MGCVVFLLSSQCQVHSLTRLLSIVSCPSKAQASPVGINSLLLSAHRGLVDGKRTGGCVRALLVLVICKGSEKSWSKEM